MIYYLHRDLSDLWTISHPSLRYGISIFVSEEMLKNIGEDYKLARIAGDKNHCSVFILQAVSEHFTFKFSSSFYCLLLLLLGAMGISLTLL
jgi:hypothetical protein